MNWLVALWRICIGWLFGRKPDQLSYTLAVVEGAFPPRLDERTVYVLTEDGEPWQAKMICPCGCKEELDLNLLPDQSPSWEAWADDDRRATLHPSVWRKIGCESHFFLRNGKIYWCRSDET